MKKLTYYLGALLLVAGSLLQSCDDEGYSIGDIAVDWATVDLKGAHTYSLTGDSWGTLWPASSSIPLYSPIDGQRVMVIFNPLYDDFEGYDCAIKVEGIREILTKQVEEWKWENDSVLGNDPIRIEEGNMWIGGGYLNVVFAQNLPKEEKHRISLVGVPSLISGTDGYIHLELRYNTNNDVSGYWVNGAVSFNLNSLEIDPGMKGIKVKIHSEVNGEVEIPFEFVSTSAPKAAQQMDFSKMEIQ